MPDPFETLDLALLQAFGALLRQGNITRAARVLEITQPAMSARLTRLRDVFGDKLFVPAMAGRGVVPTPRALALEPLLIDIMERLHRLVDPGDGFDAATSARVFTIAMQDNPAMILAPELISRIRLAAPGTRVIVMQQDTATIEADMESGRVDLLVTLESGGLPGWIGRPLLRERFVTAQRRGHPRGRGALDLETFCTLDHLLVSSGGGRFTGLVDNALAKVGRTRRVAASIQSYALAPFVIESTALLCTLPERLLGRLSAALDLFTPPIEIAAFGLSAFWHPRNQDDPGHIWLRGELLEVSQALTA